MEENTKIELPPKYYLEYFNYVLEFVKDKYKEILIHEEWAFLRKFYCLSEDAQCLFVRFTNRKGIFFKTDKLEYSEIESVELCLSELETAGFVSKLNFEQHQNNLSELLKILTKKDLEKIDELKKVKNLKKEEVIAVLPNLISIGPFFNKISSEFSIVKTNFEREVNFIKYLFFGNRYMDMTEFVVRDLGFIQYYKHQNDDLVSRFSSRKEAEDKWHISDQFEIFNEFKVTKTASEIRDWFLILNANLNDLSEIARQSYEVLILKIGSYFERNKEYEFAIETYKLTDKVPSRERQVRNLAKLKYLEEAILLCNEMVANPYNADEAIFSKDFIFQLDSKVKKTKKSTTEFLHLAESITIPKTHKNNVELGTIAYYLENGKFATFSENHLWRAIFGLFFWDIIFDPSLVSFHHPFQRRPSDLHLPQFYEKRKNQIENKLQEFDKSEDFLDFLWVNYQKHEGIANPFVIWLNEIWELVRVAVQKIELEKLKKILHLISKNIVENSRGLPDLFVWDDNNYELVEVKSPTDNLSNQQLFWLRYFKEIGINAKVLRVYFE